MKYMLFRTGAVRRKSGNAGRNKRINKIDTVRAERKTTSGDAAMSSGWILPERIRRVRGEMHSDALTRMRHSTEATRRDAPSSLFIGTALCLHVHVGCP